MLRKVYLYGVLGRRYGWRHEFDIESLPEAVWALDANHPGFKRDFLRGPAYFFVKGATRRAGLPMALAELAMPLSRHDLHIVPVAYGHGGGNGGLAVGKIVLGVAMIAGAFFTAGAMAVGTAAAAAGAEGLGIPASAAGLGLGFSVELPLIGAVTYGRIAGIGAMIALGGVSQLLSPTPQAAPSYSAERPEARPSFIYNGPTNTAEQGGPIPIVYGRMRVGSACCDGDPGNASRLRAGWCLREGAGYAADGPGAERGAQLAAVALDRPVPRCLVRGRDPRPGGRGPVDLFQDTPLQNTDGTFNFTGISWDTRYGLPWGAQSYMAGFPSSRSVIQVGSGLGIKVTHSAPVTVTFTDPSATRSAVIVKLSIPALYDQTDSDGSVKNRSAAYNIHLKTGAGPFVLQVADAFDGKCTSPYQRDHRIALPAGTSWQLKVERPGVDVDQSRIKDEFYFTSYTLATDGKLAHPNVAYCGIQIDTGARRLRRVAGGRGRPGRPRQVHDRQLGERAARPQRRQHAGRAGSGRAGACRSKAGCRAARHGCGVIPIAPGSS